jgi:transcriptional regulator with XRE-family HTH domain
VIKYDFFCESNFILQTIERIFLMEFKDVLKELFAETKTTAYKLSKETGISQGLLSKYRNGTSTPNRDNAVKIAQFFGVTVDRLSGTEQSPEDTKLISVDDLKFALWGDAKDEITEDDMNDIREYAQFVAERKKRKRDVESEKPQ